VSKQLSENYRLSATALKRNNGTTFQIRFY